jgi:5'-methylthioadenosine phosphorylase
MSRRLLNKPHGDRARRCVYIPDEFNRGLPYMRLRGAFSTLASQEAVVHEVRKNRILSPLLFANPAILSLVVRVINIYNGYMAIGLIGACGLCELDGLEISKEVSVSTPYGDPSCPYKIGSFGNSEVIFLSRHGAPHSIPPHLVNYRANIWGFKTLGVDQIISVNAAGAIKPDIKTGSLVLQNQIIDMTAGARQHTFCETGKITYIDFANPYCVEMRKRCISAAAEIGMPVGQTGVYICVNGPRLETAMEIRHFAMIGADIVGMTAMPEAALTRELGICLLGISAITNCAAGLSDKILTATEVIENMRTSNSMINRLLGAVIPRLSGVRNCSCDNRLNDAQL